MDLVSNTSTYCYLNQVFRQDDFAPLVERMQAADAAGDGVVVASDLTTVENQVMGVAAGIQVRVVWVYLTMATNWKAQLPEEVRAEIDRKHGRYAGFPNYSTAETSLSEQQANLVAAMTTWVVETNAQTFRDALAVTRASA